MHYFSFNIPDWTLATAHLSIEEECAYFRLIRLYYDTEQPIPLETQSVIRRLRLGSYEVAVASVLAEFFVKTEKGFVHARCEAELKEYRKQVKRNRENGAKGGRPSKSKASSISQSKPSGFPVGTESEPTRNPNQEPITNNQEPKGKGGKLPQCTLEKFIAARKENNEKVIPENHKVYEYAQSVGIPREFLALAWAEFKSKYTTSPNDKKKYADWPMTFLNAVKGNWGKLWFIDGGAYKLTTVGQQAELARKANVQH